MAGQQAQLARFHFMPILNSLYLKCDMVTFFSSWITQREFTWDTLQKVRFTESESNIMNAFALFLYFYHHFMLISN